MSTIENETWISMVFNDGYDLTFFKTGLFFKLYALDIDCLEWKQVDGELPEILDYLKERLTEEQFREAEKFCFEHI